MRSRKSPPSVEALEAAKRAAAPINPAVAVQRFTTTVGGSVARGRTRLRQFLGLLLFVMVATAIGAFVVGRVGAGVLALIVAVGPLFALGLVGGTDLEGLTLAGGVLTVHLASGAERFTVAQCPARRLTTPEIQHLERLAEKAGIVAGTGGYDSAQLGEFDLYATDLTHAILVESAIGTDAEEHRLVVTPDQPDAFLSAFA